MIMCQYKLEYDKNCQIPFGAYVQALNYPKKNKTQDPRKIDAIYFTVNFNKQGRAGGYGFIIWATRHHNKSHWDTSQWFFIKSVEKMATGDKSMTLKF